MVGMEMENAKKSTMQTALCLPPVTAFLGHFEEWGGGREKRERDCPNTVSSATLFQENEVFLVKEVTPPRHMP